MIDNALWLPETVLVHRSCLDNSLTRKIVDRLKDSKIEIIDEIPRFKPGEGSSRNLFLIPQQSNFLKKCPGTCKYYICCGYMWE